MGKSSVVRLEKATLKRTLGVKDLFAIGYGDLGSSIYYALGITAFFALGATPIALMLAGIVFVCTALTYAEMTSTFKDSGGSASFARRAFNDLISFIAGWGLLLDYIVTIAISIFAIAPYLSFIHQGLATASGNIGFSIGLIVLLFLLNMIGVKHSTRVSFFLTSFTLITQTIIILIGFAGHFDIGDFFSHLRVNVANQSWSPSWADFWKGVAMAMVAYTGIESIAQLGSETKQPVKSLPRAVVIVMGTLLVMYLGISMVSLLNMTPQALGTTYINNPLAGIVANLPFGNTVLGPWLGILAALLLFVAGNAGLLGASRLAYNMGEYYQLPRYFYTTHAKFRTPVVALAVFAALSCLIILWSRGQLSFLADLYNFGAMLAFFSAHASLIALRIKQPDLKRPFRAPFNISIRGYSIPLTAIIGAFATLGVWVLVVVTKPDGRYLGLAWMALGISMYLLYRKRRQLSSTGKLAIGTVKIPNYKHIEVKKILLLTNGHSPIETIQVACELAKLHGAKLLAAHILEMPYSIPLESPQSSRTAFGSALLQRAEAIAGEFHVNIETTLICSREMDDALFQLIEEGAHDLLVLGRLKYKKAASHYFYDRILNEAPCRVLICSNKY